MSEIQTLQDRIAIKAKQDLRNKLQDWRFVMSRLTFEDMKNVIAKYGNSSNCSTTSINHPDPTDRRDSDFMSTVRKELADRLENEFINLESDRVFKKLTSE